jgi:hypothetical protein
VEQGKDLWLVGSWATPTIKNDPSISELDIARNCRRDQLSARNS